MFKFKFLAAIFLLITLVMPVVSRAETVNSQITIQQLLQQISQLQNILNKLLAQQSGNSQSIQPTNDNSKTNSITASPSIKSVYYISGKNVASIMGNGLQNSRVYFNGSLIAKENHTFWTNNQISFVLPTYQPGTYSVYVQSPTGDKSNVVSLVIGGATSDAPIIQSISYITGKDVASIIGERLENARVYFNGSLISKENHTLWTSTKINFILPTYQVGSYPVYVKSSAGQSNTVNLIISN